MTVRFITVALLLPLFCYGQLFTGSSGDGFASIAMEDNTSYVYLGGSGDGFSINEIIDNALIYYVGGSGDGFDFENWIDLNNDRFSGGIADGFAFKLFVSDFTPSTCTFIQNIWIGSNGNWTDPANWSAGLIPDICHDVTINSPDVVSINGGDDALARTLTLTGALEIADGGSLSLDGRDTIGTIIQITGGRLTNAGLLAVENFTSGSISRSGIRLTSNGELLNFNTISIDSIGTNTSYGLQIINGKFSNLSTADIFIQNGVLATGFGIRNADSLVSDGNITISNFQGNGAIFNQDHFRNTGLINVYDLRGGVLNQDSIFNSGRITVENVSEFPGFRNSRVDSYFENTFSSILEINSASTVNSVDNFGTIENHGLIRVTDTPLVGILTDNGKIVNSGTIYCEFYNGVGLRAQGGTIMNSGLMEFKDVSFGTQDGIINQTGSVITNLGTIRIFR